MVKMSYQVIPELEQRIMSEIEPQVSEIYDRHMSGGQRLTVGVDGDNEVGVLNPLHELYIANGLEPQEVITAELVEHTKTSYFEHLKKFKLQNVNISPVINKTGLMNTGTEDNIAWYHAKQFELFKQFPAFVSLLSRWTAEETEHGPLIEDWGKLSGAISSISAFKNRVSQIMGGIHLPVDSLVATNAFTDPQEADTLDAHKNYGKILDSVGRVIMNKLGGQESRHNIMFRSIGKQIYSLDQEIIDYALPIEADTHKRFQMPGFKSFPNFKELAIDLAVHGLFTLEGVLQRQKERVEELGLLDLDVSTDEAKKAQKVISDSIDPDSRVNRYKRNEIEKATEEYIEDEKAKGNVPFILGRTAIYSQGKLEIVPEAA